MKPLLTALLMLVVTVDAAPASAQARLRTKWAADVTADRALPEYPRPQMVRSRWQNLNGLWDYAILDASAARPDTYAGRILVPFAIESQLSGVTKPVTDKQRLWYRRTFRAPALDGGRLLLHFGAVDWEANVAVNGKPVGSHKGGYDPFTFDITDALKPSGDQELVVSVWDPTDRGTQPRGKQVLEPKSIWYTAVTGIWQTVWLEPVPAVSISGLQIVPDAAAGTITVRVLAAPAAGAGRVQITVRDGTRVVSDASGAAGAPIVLRVPQPKLWSPDSPFLYDLRVRLGADEVRSYAGIRTMAVQRDAAGINRLFLNGKPLFQYGLLDQGWWPDGLHTAPTDAALASDIETSKQLGFNVIRKHVKVEPARWYYHCDRLGMLVWQDMPSGPDKAAENREVFAPELEHVVDALRNAPSIVMWVPFNEGWGQHQAEQYTAWLKERDPSRLVNHASGWTDKGVSDVSDAHSYPGPAMPLLEDKRAAVLGEFGGLGLPLEGHTWIDKGNWGYRSYKTQEDLGKAYRDLQYQLRILVGEGLSAAIYTQTTDVEIEVNGIMTYDRAVVKLPADAKELHARLASPPIVRDVLAASDRTGGPGKGAPQLWRYTTDAPPDAWFTPSFDATAWREGPAGFGRPDTQRAKVGTPWVTSDIWIRRTFDVPARALVNPHLRVYHDDDAEVFVNGERIATLPGASGSYMYVPLDAAASALLKSGSPNTLAIHAKQTRGGQFIDAGIVEVIDQK